MHLFKTSQDIIILCSQYSLSFTHVLIIFVTLHFFLLLPLLDIILYAWRIPLQIFFNKYMMVTNSLIFVCLKMTLFHLNSWKIFFIKFWIGSYFLLAIKYSTVLSSGPHCFFWDLGQFNCRFFESNLSSFLSLFPTPHPHHNYF